MKHVNQLLPDFITGTLSHLEQTKVNEHLANCPTCSEEYEEMQQTFSFLQRGHVQEPDRAYFTNLLTTIHHRQDQKKLFWHFLFGKTTRLMLPLSATAILLILFILLPSHQGDSSGPSGLKNVITNMQSEELTDLAVEQDKTSLVADNHELASTIVDEHLNKDYVMKDALRNDTGTETLTNMELEKTVEEFDNDQVDQLLAQLGERKNL
jgi:hypothetical protein